MNDQVVLKFILFGILRMISNLQDIVQYLMCRSSYKFRLC